MIKRIKEIVNDYKDYFMEHPLFFILWIIFTIGMICAMMEASLQEVVINEI